MNHNKKYLFLMIALLVSIFFCTFRQPWANIFVAVFFLVSLIATAYSITKTRLHRRIILGLSGAALLPVWQLVVPNKTTIEILYNAIWLTVTFYVGLMIFLEIIQTRKTTINEIYGAVSVYLLIGIFFGMIYQVVLLFEPSALYFNPTNFKILPPSYGEIFYYSFVTLCTVGFGDVSPVAPIARSISMMEALIGVMYVATMISRFIAIHTSNVSD